MGTTFRFTIEGMQKAQRDNQRALRNLQPRNAPAAAIKYITAGAYRSAVRRTPVDTGSWRASQRAGYFKFRGVVTLDDMTVNPKSGGRPAVYAVKAHPKGERYQVYEQVVAYDGDTILRGANRVLAEETFR